MAITNEQRAEIIILTVSMFDAAPSAAILKEFVDMIEQGATLESLADSLTQTEEYESLYPNWFTNEEFAEKFVATLMDGNVSAETEAEARDFVLAQLNAGASQSEAIISSVIALLNVEDSDPAWGAAKVALNNKVDVATYFAVEKLAEADTLEAMQQVVDGVDNTQASVDQAKQKIDGINPDGDVWYLGAGSDQLTGSSGTDVFKAIGPVANDQGQIVNALQSGDRLDGEGGTDTLEAAIISDYTVGSSTTGVRPITEDIEIIKIEAQGETNGIGGGDIDKANEVRLNAKNMDGMQELWSNGSEASLRVENVHNTGNTDDLLIGMRSTGNGGSETERDAADFEVYFEENELTAGLTEGQEGLSFLMMDQTAYDAGNDPLTGFALDKISFVVDGQSYSLSFANPITDTPDTYEGLATALNTLLAAQHPELVEKGLSFSVGASFTDPDGRNGKSIDLTIPDTDDSSSRLEFTNPTYPHTSIEFGSSPSNNIYRQAEILDPEQSQDLPVTAKVVLDDVGKGSDGGYLKVGSMSDGSAHSDGIEVFDLTVQRDSSLSGLFTTNHRDDNQVLKTVKITSGEGFDGDLFIGNSNSQGSVIENDLDLIQANGFKGNLSLGSDSIEVVDLAQLDAVIDGNVTFYGEISGDNTEGHSYNTGAGNDKVDLTIDATASASSQFSAQINTGSGDDTVVVEHSNASSVNFSNHSELMNVRIETGAGNDTVTASGYGAADISTGAGNDVIRTDDSANAAGVEDTASWLINGQSAAGGGVVGNGNNSYQVFKMQVQVEFQGIESAVIDVEWDTSTYTTSTDAINAAVMKAISEDPELSKLLSVTQVQNEALKIESTVDRQLAADALNINFIAPAYEKETVDNARHDSDTAEQYQGRNQVTEQELDNAWKAYYPDSNGIGSGSGEGIYNGVGNAQQMFDEMFEAVETDNLSDATDALVDYNQSQTQTGSDSSALTLNKVNAGAGDDLVILSSNQGDGFDTVVFEGNFGHDTIMNFNTGTASGAVADQLDFTAYLDAEADKRGSSVVADNRVDQSVQYRFVNDLGAGTPTTIDHNMVIQIGLSDLWAELMADVAGNPDSFSEITVEMVERALNEVYSVAAPAGVTAQEMAGSQFVIMLTLDQEIHLSANGQAALGDAIADPRLSKVFTGTVTWDATNGARLDLDAERGTIEFGDMYSDLGDLAPESVAGTPEAKAEEAAAREAIKSEAVDGQSLTVAQYKALSSAPSAYQIQDTLANIAAEATTGSGSVALANASKISVGGEVVTLTGLTTSADATAIDVVDNATSLSVADMTTLQTEGLTIAAADVVTVSDTGANLASADFANLKSTGADVLDATDNAITLAAADYATAFVTQGLQATAGDTITVNTLTGTVAATAATDRFDFAGSESNVTITGFTSGTDKVDLVDANTATTVTTATGALTMTDNAVYFLSTGNAGDADSAAAAAAALNAAASWTEADLTDVILVIADDNSSAIYQVTNTASDGNEFVAGDLTPLIGTVDTTLTAADLIVA